MKRDVNNFISKCPTCQSTKYVTSLPAGLLQPLDLRKHIWEDISMDLIIGLPLYEGHIVIFVVVDRFSKACHVGMLPTNFTAYNTAKLFISFFFRHHGFPKSIILDRGPIFVSNFWKTLFPLHGTTLRMSSTYHPQMDGQTEVLNRGIQQYLRAYVLEKAKTWGRFLIWVDWHYNTSIHSITGFCPF